MGRTGFTPWTGALVNRAVFLDRDGVINQVLLRDGRPYSPASLAELKFLPGVHEAIGALHQAGFRLIVVTNQPDVAKGRQPRDVVEAMNDRILRVLPIDDIKVCYHDDRDGCQCRKPKPGMLLEAARQWSVELGKSFVIGDRWRDVEAGKAVGCKTILIESGYAEKKAEKPDAVVHSLLEASYLILSNEISPNES